MPDTVVGEILVKYWTQIIGGAVAFLWIGKVSNKVTNLESVKPVTVTACNEKAAACKELVMSELGHGESQFQEIKGMIHDLDRKFDSKLSEIDQKSEERSNRMLKSILKN